MKIAFLSGGAREQALRYILERGENVCAVLTPLLKESNRRFEKVILSAIEYGVPVFPVTRESVKEVLSEIKPDIIVSCGFPYIVDQSVISLARYAINVHPTLLPKYRGYRSGPYILINGEQESGVTVHFITPEMDRGDILIQRKFPVSPFDTTASMYRKSQEIEPTCLYEALSLLKSGEVTTQPQNEEEASEYLHLRTPVDSQIDPQRSLTELFNEIRACDPESYPAYFYHENEKVCIKIWRPEKSAIDQDMI